MIFSLVARMSIIYCMCGLRYKIDEGLKRLRDVKPAGETFMHEGIKEVSLLSELYQSTHNQLFKNWDLISMFICLNLKALNQIQKQPTKSSSIILALTDGKLEVYIHELTVKEVRFISADIRTLYLTGN